MPKTATLSPNIVQSSELEQKLIELYEKFYVLSDKQLYDFILETVVLLTDSKIGFFHLISDDQKIIHLTTWNKEALKGCTAPKEGHYPLEQAGNWVDCVRQKKPIIYNDFAQSPNQKGLPQGHVGLKNFMSIPVIEEGKVRVIFGVGNKSVDYNNRDINIVQIFAQSLQSILKQRRTHVELLEKVEQLEKLNEYMTGRELKMVELKEEIKELRTKLAQK